MIDFEEKLIRLTASENIPAHGHCSDHKLDEYTRVRIRNMVDHLNYRVERLIAAQEIKRIIVERIDESVYASLWDHIKGVLFPRFLRKRFPPKMRHILRRGIDINVLALYPTVKEVRKGARMSVMINGELDALADGKIPSYTDEEVRVEVDESAVRFKDNFHSIKDRVTRLEEYAVSMERNVMFSGIPLRHPIMDDIRRILDVAISLTNMV